MQYQIVYQELGLELCWVYLPKNSAYDGRERKRLFKIWYWKKKCQVFKMLTLIFLGKLASTFGWGDLDGFGVVALYFETRIY